MTDLRTSLRALTPEQRLRLQETLLTRARPTVSPRRERLERAPGRRFALTPAQKRLWFLNALEGPSDQYALNLACRATGVFEFDRFARAIAALEMRHEAFRTTFVETEDGPRQILAQTSRVTVGFDDLSNLPAPDAEAAALERLGRLATTPFDLAVGPLFRAHVYRISATEHLLLIATHHIVADGWSLEVIKRDLGRFYQDAPPQAPEAAGFQLVDHAEALTRAGRGATDKLSAWVKTLEGASGSGGLPADHARRASPRAGHVLQDLPAADWAAIRSFARDCGVTPFVVLLTAFKLLLSRYAMQRDITVGTSLAQRKHPDLAEVVGLFAETVALRTQLPREGSVSQLLKQVQSCVLDGQENSDVPFEAIVEACRIPRASGRHPVFDIMFEFETGRAGDMVLGEVRLSPFALVATTPKFDMSLELRAFSEGLRIELEYRADLFEAENVTRFLANYANLLTRLIEDPDRDIATLDFLSQAETAQLEAWAQGPCVHEAVATAHQLFEAQADRTPDRVAISCGENHLTYDTVERMANRLARALTAQGIGQGHFVGLLLGRDERHLVAMLGVLKAGAAFIPLASDWSLERRRNALRDSGVTAVVSTETPDVALGALDAVAVVPWSVVDDHSLSAARPDLEISSTDVAYALYTSGSTGEPKAATVAHGGMVNHLWGKIEALDIDQDTVLAQMAITTFDVSIWQYLAALVVGGRTVVLPGDQAWDPQQLLAAVPRLGITLVESVPAHTRILLDELDASPERYDLSSLKLYVSNGEALTVGQCRRWLELVPHSPIVNTYGITETSDDVTHHRQSQPPAADADFIPIGPPMRNVGLRLLDEDLRLAPIGALGELCVSGVAVGGGYLNAPDKTAERFVSDPFSTQPNARLYRSGDLARRGADGAVQFIGRRDFQIKIRGQRIELGEVEAHLGRHPAVAACVAQVFAEDDADPKLVAYVVARNDHILEPADLSAFCEANLPTAMRPAAHVLLDVLPLTASGKVDRARLVSPLRQAQDQARPITPPRTDEERIACEIWAEAFERPAIGIDEDFFDLGGHSLLAAEVVLRLRRALGREIPLRALFAAPSIRKLLEALPAQNGLLEPIGLPPPGPGSRPTTFDLAPCQIPEWFAYRMAPESPVYNVSFTELFMRGLDVEAFVAAWQGVIERHDIFRLRFGYVEGRPSQNLGAPVRLQLDQVILDRRNMTGEAVLEEAALLSRMCSATQFDFENGPLFRFNIAAYGDGRHQLLFVVHHVIWDETSSMNLMREVSESYNAIMGSRAPKLPNLPLVYSDYVEWITTGIRQGALDTDRDYWHARLAAPPPPLAMPTDFPRPNLQDFSGASLPLWLGVAQAERVRRFCKQHDLTLFMFFLALIQLYLARLTGASDFIIGCPIAGRDYPELKPMLGLFATPMPIRWQQRDQQSFLDMATEAKAASVEAYEHYRYPATAVIDALEGARDLSKSRLFSVMYGLQNNKTQLLDDVRLDGVATENLALYSAEAHAARFDLTFAVEEKGADILFNCTYATRLFRKETVDNWLSGMAGLLDGVLTDPTRAIETYSICSQQDQALNLSVGERLDVEPDITLHGLFARQALRAPSKPCLRRETSSLSYGEVDERSNRLAAMLRARGLGMASRIGLQLGLGEDLVIAELATLKIGACFVPLGLDLPQARLDAINEVVQLDGLISTGKPSIEVAISIDLTQEDLARYCSDAQTHAVSGGDLAYILHTSGSTGTPKAIPITHANVVSIVAAVDQRHGLGEHDVVGLFTSPLFDPSILDVFWPLSVGATIAMPSTASTVTPEIFWATMLREGVTVAQCVPAMLERLVDLGARTQGTVAPNLRLMIVGGAILTRSLRDRFSEIFSARLMNHYGPTETTIDAAVFDCSHPFDGDVTPIGQALANVELHVLDAHGRPMPIGAEGELYIASPGLSLGYLGRLDLSEKVFVEVTGAGGPPRRMFRTGDVAKRRADGCIVVLGRCDRQVKLGGARVELGEIDLAACAHPAVGLSFTKIVPAVGSASPLLATFIEPAADAVTLATDHGDYEVYTREQRPDLLKAFTTLHLEAWPAFFEGDLAVSALWGSLGETFADHQICLVDADGAVAAIAHTAPYRWDGETNSLPRGWSAALAATLAKTEQPVAANALIAFVAVVAEPFKGRGLSLDLLHALRRFARGKGYDAVLIPVRPTEKSNHPHMDFAEYCASRRPDDGQLTDPWLRTHERAGGAFVRIEHCSQEVRGSFDDWRRWSGLDLDQTPQETPPGAFNPLQLDAQARVAIYREPCIWVRHEVNDAVPPLLDWSLTDLRRDLARQLPSYMTPQHIQVQQRLPLNASGKIDGARLEVVAATDFAARAAPVTTLQTALQVLWAEILVDVSPGVTCDFFLLGGRSLDVIRMLTAVEERLGVRVSVRDFYADTTIRGLERCLSSMREP